jgi:hypothetical protein
MIVGDGLPARSILMRQGCGSSGLTSPSMDLEMIGRDVFGEMGCREV